MRYTTSINTLLVEVASRDGAEAIARELPNNRSLTHLTLGGPVPQELMAQMNATLAANTMRSVASSPGVPFPTAVALACICIIYIYFKFRLPHKC
jgi:hypothetical protein